MVDHTDNPRSDHGPDGPFRHYACSIGLLGRSPEGTRAIRLEPAASSRTRRIGDPAAAWRPRPGTMRRPCTTDVLWIPTTSSTSTAG
ncbi:MAG: hypothetical protein JRE18_02035 [Deltaproteobacteria bacterium]|nr:hypothetical protein [Deltaproteobacteria bacterium]